MTKLKHSKERKTTSELSAQKHDHRESLIIDKPSLTSLSPYLAASPSNSYACYINRSLKVNDIKITDKQITVYEHMETDGLKNNKL